MADFFFDQAIHKKIGETCGDGVTVFTTNFASSYKSCYIESVKEEAQPEEEVVYLLSKPPTPSVDLKVGLLSKRSDFLKAWRERTCVATNEADNFRVNFLTAAKRNTGFVDLCGYNPKKTDDLGINLVPSCERRKTWFLKCKSKEDQDAWMDVFELACEKCQPPVSKDPVIRDAFAAALTATREHFGFHGAEPVVMTEPETIADLITAVIERDVLTESHKKMGILTNIVRGQVAAVVNSSAAACWKSCLATIEPTKKAIDTAVKPILTKFFEKEGEIKEKITAAIGDKVNPFMEEQSKKTLTPVLDVVSTEIVATLCATISEFHKVMGETVSKDEYKEEKSRGALLQEIESDIAVQRGVLSPAHKIMSDCAKNQFTKIANLLDKSAIQGLVRKIMNKNEQLASYALFTFGEKLTELGVDADAAVAINDTVVKMINDAALYYSELVESILTALLADPIAETVTPPCATAVEPIQEVINSIEGLSDFFQLDSLTEDCIGDVVGNAVSAASEGSVSKGSETIAALKTELKV